MKWSWIDASERTGFRYSQTLRVCGSSPPALSSTGVDMGFARLLLQSEIWLGVLTRDG